MGNWLINADTIARSHFVVSPLAETIAGLKTLATGSAAHPGERAWLYGHLSAYRRRLAEDPVAALLVDIGLCRSWNAEFLTPTPTGEEDGESSGARLFAREVAGIRATPPQTAAADLTVSLGGPLPEPLRRDDLAQRAAALLDWVWQRTVLPDWPRRRRVLEADVVRRVGRVSRYGWAGALDDMRPGMRWLGEGQLRINTYDHSPREVAGAGLLFVPVTPQTGWVSWEEQRRFAVVYPCSGVLTGEEDTAETDALAVLLGPARAGVLRLLAAPMSTTMLVALTGQGLGSVGRHLKVLLDAGLVVRARAGRSVLYERTDAGDVLVRAAPGGHGADA
ncbi:ArsR/SmtB family transcription factor [Streptomyces tsukubensis]|uniref:Transcriptional regulator n=1 Tax=Streptomyces tsukubensis TaxID=83656 RepID=A0A1V4A0L3_9ACTN|nr:winged helix-turn-helix domain-containing protein [Streptomyces tsukubensis]OON72410.1 transcriptional regulator [Streptomyces tsukubensis]QFR96938.1 helix-turn-helix domain-containing protein [Streptomyces tsukubensis]